MQILSTLTTNIACAQPLVFLDSQAFQSVRIDPPRQVSIEEATPTQYALSGNEMERKQLLSTNLEKLSEIRRA